MAQVATSVSVIPSSAGPDPQVRSFGIQHVKTSTSTDVVEMTIEVLQRAYTSVQIFDARGRRVRAIVDEATAKR